MGIRYTLIEWDGKGSNYIVAPDIPLSNIPVEATLSGDSSVSATLEIPFSPILDEKGKVILKRWTTGLVVERDGSDAPMAVYVLSDYTLHETTIDMSFVSMSGVLNGQPYRAVKICNKDDPAALFRHIWSHMQSWPGANYGVTVNGYATSVRIGYVPKIVSTVALDALRVKKDAARDAANKAYAAASAKPKDKALKATYQRLLKAAQALEKQYSTASDTVSKQKDAASAWNQAQENAGWEQYVIAWYDNATCGDKAVELAKLGGFDFREVHSWVGDSVATRIDMFRSASSTINQGRFAVGENVIEEIPLTFPNDGYATDVWVTGAGDGHSMIQTVSPKSTTGEVTRWRMIADSSIKSVAALKALAASTALEAYNLSVVSDVVTINHPNAPHGSVALGDYIYVIGSGKGYNGTIDKSVRVIGTSYDPSTDRMTYRILS